MKIEAEKREKLFRKDPFDHVLKTYKLTGRLKDFWAFSIDRKNRIIFDFVDKYEVLFHKVGSHDVYKK